jgi:hypothetical protein
MGKGFWRLKGRICLLAAPVWCNVVKNSGSKTVKNKRGYGKGTSKVGTAVRASISFPPDVYESLEIIAKEKKVSLAWVVRDAAEQYVGDKWPLFNRKTEAQQ